MTTQRERLIITTQYAPGTYALYNGRFTIGTATESKLEPGSWLCDVRLPKDLGFMSIPPHRGSLLSALRYVRKNRLMPLAVVPRKES